MSDIAKGLREHYWTVPIGGSTSDSLRFRHVLAKAVHGEDSTLLKPCLARRELRFMHTLKLRKETPSACRKRLNALDFRCLRLLFQRAYLGVCISTR